ncbi:MAG: class I SAM-dependent methyltransferase [Bryobacterales bacterium]|jgi:SAM-dependent methyltransferase|nr:class I SAM-dependent methyltransferase [Bryobacterales bacterium]
MHTESESLLTRRGLLSALLPAACCVCQTAAGQSAVERWDSVYRQRHPRLPVQPSQFLVQSIDGIKPGLALDVGMGQGRNALYLARAGWTVVGIDISAEAVRQVNDRAQRERLSVRALQQSLQDYALPAASFDLILLMYLHNLQRADTQRLQRALRPGGRVLLEAYHVDVAHADISAITGVPRGYSEQEIKALFDGLTVQVCQRVDARSDWSNGPQGTAPLLRFTAARPR